MIVPRPHSKCNEARVSENISNAKANKMQDISQQEFIDGAFYKRYLEFSLSLSLSLKCVLYLQSVSFTESF